MARKKHEEIDMEKVERIVEKMRKKYAEQGIQIGPAQYTEIASLIAEGKVPKIEIQRVEELKESESPIISTLGKFYLKLRNIMEPIHNLLAKFPLAKKLDWELYSANMRFSAKLWLALATATGVFVTLVSFAALVLLSVYIGLDFLSYFIDAIIATFIGFIAIMAVLIYPSQRAKSRGRAISAELPFALRHIATQLSAGIGLYRTFQAVAKADYGPLSEEFSRTIAEIEEGMEIQEALRRLALRNRSQALRNAVMHTIRALKTGGNLSDVMNEIAEDVAFQLRTAMQEFGQKMNVVGVFFIFFAIVIPVFVAILGALRNTPLSYMNVVSPFAALPLSLDVMALIFVLVMPLLLAWVFMLIRVMLPHA